MLLRGFKGSFGVITERKRAEETIKAALADKETLLPRVVSSDKK